MTRSLGIAFLLAVGCVAQFFTTTTGEDIVVTGTSVATAAESAASSVDASFTTTGPFTTITSGVVVTTTGNAASITATTTVSPTPVFPDAPSFADAASSVDQVSSLVNLLQQDRFSSVLQLLAGTGTVLAPNNDALDEFSGTDAGQRFQDDDDFAVALLTYHSLIGVFSADAFPEGGLLTSRWFETSLFNMSARPNVGGYTSDGDVTLLSGGLDESMVVQANLQFDGGYIHVIDKVLTLPDSISNVLVAGGFQALLGALEASALDASALNMPSGITLFAPTNEAFENIGNLLGSLSAQDITNTLSYHVIQFPAYASDLKDGLMVDTLAGEQLMVTIRDGDDGTEVFVNGARVTMPNMPFINGVVHGIDQVLNPNNAASPADSEDGQPQFSGASSVAKIPLTSGQPTATAPSGSQSSTESYTGAAIPMVTQMPWMGMAIGMAAVAAAV